MEVEEDLSSWDDLYGSSHDLVPSLLNIFDAMIAQTSLRATEADLPLKLRPESPESPTSSHIVSNVPSTTPGWSNGPTSPGTRKGYPVLRIIEPGDPVEQTRIESPTLILKKQSTLQNGQMQSSTGAINVESSNADCATSKDRETSKRLQYTDVIKRKLLNDTTLAHRPSSSSSSSSSSSLTSVASSVAPASYLASIESLTDKENTVTVISSALRNSAPHARFTANEGQRHSADSGDSGVCSPGAVDSTAIGNGSTRHAGSSDVTQLSYMDRVVMEIVETETVYVRDLEDVVEGYLNYWAQAVPSPLNEDESKNLFSNINQIYAFNAAFLKELRSCELDPVEIARCFVRNNTGFTIYTEYCTNYPRTVSVLTDLMRVETTARAFRERQTSLQHTLPLGSYLLKPVQRILKYHLLLQNIVKHYDRTSDGYADILVALSAMTGIAHHINDMKRRHEHAVRVQEIQSLLYGWQGEDLTTYGELVAEGHFRLYGAKALRHVFLFDQMLLICKRKEDGTLSYKTHIMCSNLMLIESVNGEPLSFHVVPFDNPRLQYTLEARNMEQKREWTLQLKRVILENYHAEIPTHARQLVMQLGQERPERDVSVERNGPKRQHSAPEYLERRKHSTAGLKSKLRRSRKSSVTSPKESPLLPRRFRRSLDSSPSLADSNKDCKEIFRKCSTISCPPEMDMDKSIKWRHCSEQTNIPGSPSSSVDFSMQESRSSNTLDAEETEEEDISETRPSEESLEKIVGQLVLQNRDIQRILLRQRRKRFEPADSKSLQDHSFLPESQESICESLLTKSFESDDATLGAPLHPNDPTDTEDKNLTALKRNCSNRRSLGTCTSLTPQPAPVPNIERSLSCPARQKVQIRKSVSLTRKVSNVIHCDLAHWQEVLRSLSPQRRLNFLGQSKHKPPQPLPDSVTSNHSKVTAHESENPNVPEVWLRLQEEHLSSAQLKSGSLPRSFSWQQDASKRNRDRPVTIASDKPDLHEDYESYRMSLEETRSVDFSSESLQDQELSYPDYRIYRRSPSRSSLRAVIHSVSNKIAHMKSSDLWSSWFNLTEEEKQTKWISTLSRQYSQIMKQRVRSRPSQVDLHHQTATVGARIANTDLADYAVPCVRPKGESCFTDLNSSQDKISDSMYSLSSGLGTNESESSGTLNSRRTVVSSHFEDEDSDLERSESELSNDSFYERSFEAIESLLDQEVYRDSAIFSDKDDLSSLVSGSNPSSLTRGIDPSVLNQENPVVRGKASVPPPVPAKPSRALLQNLQMDLWKENAIADRVKLLEENSKFKKTNGLTSSLENLKSIQERRKELETFSTKTGDESETSSQHSTSTVNTVLEVHFNPSASGSPEMDRSRPSIRYAAVQRRRGVSCDSLANRDSLPVTNSNAALPKGWVKHIIGRLQGES